MSQAVTVQCHMWHLPYLLLKETSVQDNIFTMLIKLITQTLHETCALGGPPLLSISLFKMLHACVILEKQVFRNHVFHLELSFFVYDTDMNIYEPYPPSFFSWTKLFLVIQCQITFSPTKYETSVCVLISLNLTNPVLKKNLNFTGQKRNCMKSCLLNPIRNNVNKAVASKKPFL